MGKDGPEKVDIVMSIFMGEDKKGMLEM